jgi:hypothetical protein
LSSGTGGSSAAGGSATTTSTSQGTGGVGGGQAGTVSYTATVADCINPDAPDPDECEQTTGFAQMTVDLDDQLGAVRHVYLRFDLDAALLDMAIDGVELKLTTTNRDWAAGAEKGDLWEVDPFARPDLFAAAPNKIGAMPLAPSAGRVGVDAVATWPLPTSIVSPNAGVFFGILPLNNDGVDYVNLHGATAPVLAIAYHSN